MSQPNSTLPTWTAVLSLPAGLSSGTFAVTGYCTGVFTLLTANASLLIGVERVTSDPRGACADSGAVTLQAATGGTRLLMRWVDAAHQDNVATGTLTKR
jgi:hypothetical protein